MSPRQSILYRPRWGAQKGVLDTYKYRIAYYTFSPAESIPNPPKSAPTMREHPGMLFPALLTFIY
jgi:hypothetical protein